jgi:hypothetical protein
MHHLAQQLGAKATNRPFAEFPVCPASRAKQLAILSVLLVQLTKLSISPIQKDLHCTNKGKYIRKYNETSMEEESVSDSLFVPSEYILYQYKSCVNRHIMRKHAKHEKSK